MTGEATVRELLLAILAMDSYNQGYGRGLKFSSTESLVDRAESGVSVGNAKIAAEDRSGEAQAISFRASGECHFFNENSKRGITGLALSKSVFDRAQLWRERSMLLQPLFFSDELQAAIVNAGLRISRHYRARET